MASKAKAAPVKEEAEIATNNDEPENKGQAEKAQNINNDSQEDKRDELLTEEQRRNQRKEEWGTQFDRWLIRCQQRSKPILLYLGEFDPNISENGIDAVPKRIDQHFVQFEINGREIWIGKRFITGVEPVQSGD